MRERKIDVKIDDLCDGLILIFTWFEHRKPAKITICTIEIEILVSQKDFQSSSGGGGSCKRNRLAELATEGAGDSLRGVDVGVVVGGVLLKLLELEADAGVLTALGNEASLEGTLEAALADADLAAALGVGEGDAVE